VFHVAENQPAGSHVGSVSAIDRDQPPRGQFVYAVESPVMSFHSFHVNATSGRVSTTKTLDRERQDVYQITVIARPTTNQSAVIQHVGSRSKAAVTIYVNDVNDNRPVFTFPRPGNDTLIIAGQVPGDKPQVRAYDLDRGVNGVVRYSVVAGNASTLIKVVRGFQRPVYSDTTQVDVELS